MATFDAAGAHLAHPDAAFIEEAERDLLRSAAVRRPVPSFPGATVNANASSADHGDAPHHSAVTRMSWALKRVFEIDIEQCP